MGDGDCRAGSAGVVALAIGGAAEEREVAVFFRSFGVGGRGLPTCLWAGDFAGGVESLFPRPADGSAGTDAGDLASTVDFVTCMVGRAADGSIETGAG